jgi:hypothetical protein
MSTDYAEKERDFIASLPEDTGRDLSAWMTAITESGLSERNAIIDWLRLHGFQFSQASWLERIHHNGGRLIYGDDAAEPSTLPGKPAPPTRSSAHAPRVQTTTPVTPPTAAKQTVIGDSVQQLLAGAKGLRPLADLVLREVSRAVANVEFTAESPFIVISAPQPFAALLPGPKRLRLYATFGPAGVHRARPADTVNKSTPRFPEMLVLDDARDINEDFQRLIRAAARQ